VGEAQKVDWVRKLKHLHNVDFLGLQETRVLDYNLIDVRGCWGSGNFNFSAVNPTGRSGGLINIWNSNIFNVIKSVTSRHFIAISGQWKGFPGTTTIVNVYAPQSISDKRTLWHELLKLKIQSPEHGSCSATSTRSATQRKGSTQGFANTQLWILIISSQMQDFKNSRWENENSLS